MLGILGDPHALVLPVFTYAFGFYAIWSRYMRSNVLDNLVQDYVRTARAKGASERQVIWGHVFRNSLVSIVTLLGLSLPALVGGAILIEVVFNFPGMGLAFYQAALNNDFNVLLGFTVIATTATIMGNLLADIGYGAARPEGEVLMSVPEAQVIAATDAELGLVPLDKPRSIWFRAWEVFAQNKLALAGLGFIVFILLFCFVGPHIYVTNQTNTNLINYLCTAVGLAPARLQRPRVRRARPADGRRPDLDRGRPGGGDRVGVRRHHLRRDLRLRRRVRRRADDADRGRRACRCRRW